MWYRKDGTPRSKVRGAIYTLIGSCAVLLAISGLEVLEDLQDVVLQLAATLQVQRVDFDDFSNVDFSDYKKTTEYFSAISTPFLITAQYSDEESVDNFFHYLLDLENGALKERIHVRMREAAEEVHETLKAVRDEPLEAFQDVVKVIRQALLDVITDVAIESDENVAALVKSLRDDSDRAPPGKGRGYEIIG